MACQSEPDIPPIWQLHRRQNYVNSPSNSSTTSSTSSSAFSIDAPSSQSSVATSTVGWSSSAWAAEKDGPFTPTIYHPLRRTSTTPHAEVSIAETITCQKPHGQSVCEAVPSSSRQNPRRTQRLNVSDHQNGQQTSQCPRAPPTLIRQCDRKDNFVDNLVDAATQMVETIWPLSVLTCGRDTILGAKQQNLIGLRTFVQEVLRRSKTSYSTLQVALYYLVLIQHALPRFDFTMEQADDSSACRAMQCGRRMFLAALILASKYLQDRNFSARAWSRISGLRTCEINTNELAFLSAVRWKLHITETIYQKWVDIVLSHSPSGPTSGPSRSLPPRRSWKSIIPLLTPELDSIDDLLTAESPYDSGYDSPGSDMSPPPLPASEDMPLSSSSNEATPTNHYTTPKAFEPTPQESPIDFQVLPSLPRLGTLPTPQLTPQTGAFCTPAVRASGFCHRASSMSFAMGEIRRCEANRMTLDNMSHWRPKLPEPFPTSARRSSLATSMSSMSSPESTASDRSSRPSRSSSISSIASSNCALPPPNLAVQATRRCATMQLSNVREEGSSTTCPGKMPTIAYDLPRPGFLQSSSTIATNVSKSYCSSQPGNPAVNHEAAVALQDLALSRQLETQTQSANASPTRSLKRSRSTSIDDSLQSSVRQLLFAKHEDDGNVLSDPKVADSFLLQAGNARAVKSAILAAEVNPVVSRECSPRKRTCAASDRNKENKPRMHKYSSFMAENALWQGIL